MTIQSRGPNLSFPPMPSASTVGRTLQESEHHWRQDPRRIPEDAPRGVYQDGWFACAFGPRAPWRRTSANIAEWNPDEDVWELYNLEEDFSQANDLAEAMPEKLQATAWTWGRQFRWTTMSGCRLRSPGR